MKIIHCGDSFTFGVGCDNVSEYYASIVSDHFGSEHINLGRSAGSNLAIHLQVKMALEMEPDLLVVNTTSTDRLEWIADNANPPRPLTALHLSYANVDRPSYISQLPGHVPAILCDQIYGIANPRYHGVESQHKLDTLLEYGTGILDGRIKQDYDVGIIAMTHAMIRKHQIPCLILAGRLYQHLERVGVDDLLHVDFFDLSMRYPDKYKTTHCSEVAHQMVADKVIDRIRILNLEAAD